MVGQVLGSRTAGDSYGLRTGMDAERREMWVFFLNNRDLIRWLIEDLSESLPPEQIAAAVLAPPLALSFSMPS